MTTNLAKQIQATADYCNSLTRYSRFKTREVTIGSVPLGGDNPIRVQSMTTTDTMDTLGTVDQCIRMIEAGCEYIRITAPNLKQANNLENIKKELRARGFDTPLIADIHFTPNAAELAARIIEKVRINPGNYADRKRFDVIDYSDASYQEELDRIRKRFTPLVKICKEYGTAMRIGTNHGSLSDRILSRYGDTPMGMVESALEFLRICEDLNYHNIVISMKASNPQVMVQAYRLLVASMQAENMNYPLHLGVTEAGDGEDGRIKSAVGIGTLLEDGLGDTVRVSLTEDPEFEPPVAAAMINRYQARAAHRPIAAIDDYPIDPMHYLRRATQPVLNMGGPQVPVVIADYSASERISVADLTAVGYQYNLPTDKWNLSDQACDFIYVGEGQIDFEIPGSLGILCDFANWQQVAHKDRHYPLLNLTEYLSGDRRSPELNFLAITIDELNASLIQRIREDATLVLVLESDNAHAMAELRRISVELIDQGCKTPVILKRSYADADEETLRLYASTDLGALLLDGIGDGVWLGKSAQLSHEGLNRIAFGILQATRTRISKTEYIACPSCGRTLFDLQETTAKIRSETDHLKGVKIGIMGCIVNGPGEMADADYGYVGMGPGKIALYKGQEVVQRNIPSEQAVDALVDLIREHGDWRDPA